MAEAEWTVQFPVNYEPDGDRTNLAISKHINEFARLYALLALLRSNFFAANAPAGAAPGQLYITPGDFELKVWDGSSWGAPKAFPLAHGLDVHSAGLMADLQALVSDATLLYMLVAPEAADNGKVLVIDSRGKVVLSNRLSEQAASVATLNAAITLINQSFASLAARVLALEEAKSALEARVLALEEAAANMPVLESVAALPEEPVAGTWYFVQEAEA